MRVLISLTAPAEKINSINVNHISGMGHGGSSGGKSDPVGLAMVSIMDMAVQLPLLKKIGDQMGVSFDEVADFSKKPKD